MEFNVPKVQLLLKTSDISTSNVVGDYPLSNSKGSVSQYRTSIVWNAVQLKNILGTLYDEYELFSIGFSNYGWATGTTLYGASANDRAITYGITGFDWVFANYSSGSGNCTNQTFLDGLDFPAQPSGSRVVPYLGATAIFRKQPTVDIGINLNCITGGPPAMNIGTIWPQMIFDFTITPIK